MIYNSLRNKIFSSLIFLFSIFNTFGQKENLLQSGFFNPPHAAKPVVWWHWTGSNVTKEGITKDLEWMQRTGIGGFQLFDVAIGGGQTVDKKTKYMSPEWLEMVTHTATEADRLGLDMTMVTAAGWSETGGPWVKPEEAMKKLVWSQTNIKGGKHINQILVQPPIVNGPIRNLPKTVTFLDEKDKKWTPFYADQIVLAYKTPQDELETNIPKIINYKGENIDSKNLLDDDLTTGIHLDVPTKEQGVYFKFEYKKPFTARSFSFAMGGAGMFSSSIMRQGYIQVSDDDVTYKTIVALPGAQHDIRALPVRTFSFPEVTAKYFRLVFIPGSGISTVGGPDDFGGFGQPTSAPKSFEITEAIFNKGARVNRWEDKANFAPMYAFENLKTAMAPQSATINEVVDLTSKMKSDGTLVWDAPSGNWTILRIGYSLTGAKNGPAVNGATGYEVDKLNKEHLQSYMRQWSNPIAEAMGSMFGKSMKYYLIDSYEADAQNWTETMIPEFITRRGYDPIKYLPVLTGKIVESSEVSDRFLWDFRLTIAEMLTDNHYAAISEFAHKQGLKTYGEVAGISLPIIQDALRNKSTVDIPMGEFGMTQNGGVSGEKLSWTAPADFENQKAFGGANDRFNANQSDIREAASAAHIYGKKVVASESWTGGGYEAPSDLKFIGDYWYSQGINQLIFHTSAHQPLDTKPGNTMVGIHFHRNITWAEQAKPFVDYLSRTQFLLQEGRFVADIAYYLGKDIPAVVPYWEKLKNEAPEGFNYDFVNTEILNRFEVENGELVLPTGMRYKVLVLPEKYTMTLSVLAKIKELVKNGATIVGPKPVKSPSLVGYPNADNEVLLQANELWGGTDGQFIYENDFGKGKVFWNAPLKGILGQMNVKKDIDYTKPHTDTKLSWMHRKTADSDYYFLLNMRNQIEDLEVQFRIEGKIPELWDAVKGTIIPLSYDIRNNGITSVKLHLEPQQSVFVVFQKEAKEKQLVHAEMKEVILEGLDNSWKVSFPQKSGVSHQVVMDRLISWSDYIDDAVKYFSGTATYRNDFEIKKEWINSNQSIVLDLGKVKDIAEVYVNDLKVGTLWNAPYQLDISKGVKKGKNRLEIRITNQWDNHIIGEETKAQSAIDNHIKLKESGLMGPVVLKLK